MTPTFLRLVGWAAERGGSVELSSTPIGELQILLRVRDAEGREFAHETAADPRHAGDDAFWQSILVRAGREYSRAFGPRLRLVGGHGGVAL